MKIVNDIMDQTFFLEQQNMPAGSLYVVSTPIGNLGDITYRAVHVLKAVDGIACEDTRHTSHLLNAIGIQKPLMAIHEHNEKEAANALIQKLKHGERWAYVCDAGTPGISDPGARLTKELISAGYLVIPIPGASALTTLLSVAGKLNLSAQGNFQFLSFLPLKGKERSQCLSQMNLSRLPSIFYESPLRINKTLAELHEKIVDKNRAIMIGRELTKKFETITTLHIHEIPAWLEKSPETRGEFCVMLEGSLIQRFDAEETSQEVNINPIELAQVLTEHLGSKQIAEIFSKSQIMSKNAAYELALKLKRLKQ